MRPGLIITLAIIAGSGFGAGAIVTGTLILKLGSVAEKDATLIGVGAAVLAASVCALVAHIGGCFKSLDRQDY
jgi:hypothetical protein